MEREHKIDRRTWPAGPWDGEPDRVEWRHLGLPCLAVRASSGAWCGYVGLPPGHRWHGVSYEDVGADVHGGLTYGSPCQADGPICHVPAPGEPDDLWWIGFDCNHLYDLAPGHESLLNRLAFERGEDRSPMPGYRDIYRDLGYVRAEVERLAEQMAPGRAE